MGPANGYAERISYRDDTDAALARAEALELELARSEAERARLAARVHELERVDPEAPVFPRPDLLVEIEAGLAQTYNTRAGAALACMLLLLGAPLMAHVVVVGAVLTGLATAALIWAIKRRDRAAMLVDVLKHRPEELASVQVGERGIWLTARGRTMLCVTSRGHAIAEELVVRYPSAKLLREPDKALP